MLDYLIVGCGLFGSTFARLATDRGASCLVIDKRDHIAGNCYTKRMNGIDVHMYGPHTFHTNSRGVWDFVNQFADFNNFVTRTKVSHGGKIYSFPINLFTLSQVWGVESPTEAIAKLEEVRHKIDNPRNLEEWCLSQIGEELYNIFIYGFTKKQWGREPRELPASIIKRLPIRLTHNDNFFSDKFEGVPARGYTELFENMLDGIPVELNCDYLSNKDRWKSKKVVYTGPIDEFFNYEYGQLEWRSLRFEHILHRDLDYQGNAIINYAEESVPFKRIIEHKHFYSQQQKDTVITKEYPQAWVPEVEKIYTINNDKNNLLYQKYKKLIPHDHIFGGRLAEYRYYDMHQVVGAAIASFKRNHSG